MKKILILSVLIVLISINASGQFEKPITKGYMIVGGNINFGMDNYKITTLSIKRDRDRYHFNAELSVGYFVLDHFVGGLKTGLVLNRDIIYQESVSAISIFHEYQLKPFLRYYTSFGIFVEADIGYGFQTTGWISGTRTNDYYSFTWSSGLGYGLFLNRNLAIESKVLYKKWRKEESYSVVKEETSGVYVIIGFQIYLSTRKTKIANLNE